MNYGVYLKDLSLIEKVILKTYGPIGKAALIQATNSTLINSFMTTNDGFTLITSMNFSQNQFLKIISNSIKNHSFKNGDQCKSLFIYCFNLLNNLHTHKDESEKKHLFNIFRTQNVYNLIEKFLSEWKNNTNLIKIKNKNEFVQYLPKLCVFYDLDNLNKLLSEISCHLLLRIIKHYSENCTESNEIKPILEFLTDNFNNLVIYSDKACLNESKFYSNGFLINRRFLIKQLDSSQIKALILIKQSDEFNSKTNTFLTINSNLKDLLSNYEQKFPNEFIQSLKENKINLILNTGCLSDVQKSQLISINCSIISYIDYDYIKFISESFGLKLMYISNLDSNLNEYLIEIESITSLNNDDLFYLKLNLVNVKFGFIHFCAPVKMFYNQFKLYYLKVIKTLLNLFNGEDLVLVKCKSFEKDSFKLCDLLKLNSVDSQECLVYKFLNCFFDTLMLKLQRCKYLNDREYLLNKLNLETLDNKIVLYEPFEIKIKCLLESLNILKFLLKIDSICFVNKLLKTNIDDSDSD